MKPVILCLTVFLLIAINSFSQVLQKKQTTAPVIQKTDLNKTGTTQPKAIAVNPAEKQFVKPMDTANAKLTDILITLGYSTPANASRDLILTHYKPHIDLFDENNRPIAHWEVTNEDYTNSNIQNQTPDNSNALVITFHMKIDNTTTPSFASFKKGTIKISNVTFYNGNGLVSGSSQDFFAIKHVQGTLKFLGPSLKLDMGAVRGLEGDIESVYYDDNLSLQHPATVFSFSCPTTWACYISPNPVY
ncbi:MAG TPA: hypothetical protein VGI82_09325 [Chitinophagaceae bacterium]